MTYQEINLSEPGQHVQCKISVSCSGAIKARIAPSRRAWLGDLMPMSIKVGDPYAWRRPSGYPREKLKLSTGVANSVNMLLASYLCLSRALESLMWALKLSLVKQTLHK